MLCHISILWIAHNHNSEFVPLSLSTLYNYCSHMVAWYLLFCLVY